MFGRVCPGVGSALDSSCMITSELLSMIQKRLIVFASIIFLILAPASVEAQRKKLRVYLFAGQSNCTGGGGRVPKYPVDLQGWKSPFIYKMMQDLRARNEDGSLANPPDQESTWFKNSGTDGRILNGKRQIGTRASHLLYPFHTLWRPENGRRLEASLSGDYEAASRIDYHLGESSDFYFPSSSRIGWRDGFNSFIGPEIEFARLMRIRHPDSEIAIIKVSAGGSSIRHWEPATRFWNPAPNGMSRHEARKSVSHLLFYKHLRWVLHYGMQTLRDMPDPTFPSRSRYASVELSGFVWIHGESDLHGFDLNAHQYGLDYKDSFRRMINALRHWHGRKIPFVISRTKGFLNQDIIQNGNQFQRSDRLLALQITQMELANEDPLGSWIDTDDIPNQIEDDGSTDRIHFGSAGLTELGLRVFEAFEEIDSP